MRADQSRRMQTKAIADRLRATSTLETDIAGRELDTSFLRLSALFGGGWDEKELYLPVVIYGRVDEGLPSVTIACPIDNQTAENKIHTVTAGMGFRKYTEGLYVEYVAVGEPETVAAQLEKKFEVIHMPTLGARGRRAGFSLGETGALVDMALPQLHIAVSDKEFKPHIFYYEGRRYINPDGLEYLLDFAGRMEERRKGFIKFGKALPGYITKERWNVIVKTSKEADLPTAEEIARLFGSWKKFMGTCSLKKGQKPSVSSKEDAIRYAKIYESTYGAAPIKSVWVDDPDFPSIKELRKFWQSFDQFLHELGYAVQEKIPSNKIQAAVRELALQEKTLREIMEELDIKNRDAKRYLRKAGVFDTAFLRRNLPTLQHVKTRQYKGINLYEKDNVRDELILSSIDALTDPERISYLGLEGPNFGSFIRIADVTGINAATSLVAERDPRAYLMMQSIVRRWKAVVGAEIFRGLNLYFGNLSEALQAYADKGFRFDFLNLDYAGPLNQEKISTFAILFGNQQVADDAVMFVTLNNSPIARYRLRTGNGTLGRYHSEGFPTDDQAALTEYYLREFSRQMGFSVGCIANKPYRSRETEMLTLGYKLRKDA